MTRTKKSHLEKWTPKTLPENAIPMGEPRLITYPCYLLEKMEIFKRQQIFRKALREQLGILKGKGTKT